MPPTVRQPQGPNDNGFSGVDPNSLPEDLKAIYNSMLGDYRKKTEELAAQRKEIAEAWESAQSKLGEYEQTVKAYESWAGSLVAGGVIDEQGNPTGASPNVESAPAVAASGMASDDIGFIDSKVMNDYVAKKLAENNAAWTKYATDMQAWVNKAMLRMGTYVTNAARILAKDPTAPIDQIYETAVKTGGDLDKAYEMVMTPVRERRTLEEKNKELAKQLKDAQAKMPATLGQLPGRGMPIRPVKSEKFPIKTAGGTGKYATAMAKAPIDGVIVPDTSPHAGVGAAGE